jgi:hypothetical protein
MNLRRVIKLLACIGFLVLVSVVYSYSGGPLPGFTGAPGEGSCTECHDSFDSPNQGAGEVNIEAPSRYEEGQRLTITVRVNQPGQQRWGFQITALTVDGEQPAGQFLITDPEHTQLIPAENGRWYVEHTDAGTFSGQRGGASWTFDWIAPETDAGPVVLYAAGNAANGDGDRLGDWIYQTNVTVSPPSYPAVSLLSPNGGEVLGVSETFTVGWDAIKADSFYIFYYPRTGALPKAIASNLPGNSRSFEWKVTETVTDQARIGILAFNDVGSGLDESAAPFLIVDKSSSVIEVIEPSGSPVVNGGTRLEIAWQVSAGVSLTSQQVRLSLDGGRTYLRVLAASLAGEARRLSWTVPTDLHTQSARVLVLGRVAGGNLVADDNDADFVIFNPMP